MSLKAGDRGAMHRAASDATALLTARTGSGQFYVVDEITAQRVGDRLHLVIGFQPYASVTISISVEKAHQVIDAVEAAVRE